MRILSFDTSTPNLYACLAEKKNILAEQILICNPQDRQFSASLIMPTLIELLEKTNWHKQDLQAITVGIGPGSFTGTRVAVVTARTLCQALNLPLLGINRFQCYAFKEQIRSFPSAMVLQAGKKQYFCAHLHSDITVDDSATSMDTFHLSENNLLIHLRDFKDVYIEKSTVSILAENISQNIPKNWHALPDLINPAIIQTQIAFKKLQSLFEPLDFAQFSYKQTRPLYVQNASITIKSSPASVN